MKLSLVMFKSDGTRREFPVHKDRIVIGRKPTCDLRIPLLSVSRQHCEIEINGESVKVRDLGSSNGTFHNSERIQEQELAAGDELTVGPVVFTVVIDGEPSKIEPVHSTAEEPQLQDSDAYALADEDGQASDDRSEPAPTAPTDTPQEALSNAGPESDSGPEEDSFDLDDPLAALERMAEAEAGGETGQDDAVLPADEDVFELADDADVREQSPESEQEAEDPDDLELLRDDDDEEDQKKRRR